LADLVFGTDTILVGTKEGLPDILTVFFYGSVVILGRSRSAKEAINTERVELGGGLRSSEPLIES
jgi:hypothetical protein